MWGQFSTKVELKIHGAFTFPPLCYCVAKILLYLLITYEFMSQHPGETMLSFLAGVESSWSYSMLIRWWICWVFGHVLRVQSSIHPFWWMKLQLGWDVKLQDTDSHSHRYMEAPRTNQRYQFPESWIGALSVWRGSVCPLKLQPQCSDREQAHKRTSFTFIYEDMICHGFFLLFVCLFIVLSFSIFSTSKILYLSLTSSFYTNFCAYLNSPLHAVFFFFVQVIRQGRVEIQVCPLTGAGRRVIFGSAARCISAVLRATCSLAPPRGCAYPMAPGLERSLPANVSRLQSWVYDLQAPLLYFSHYIFTVFKTRTWTQFSDTLGVIFISLI